jgi:hypothetical protein
MRGIKCDFTSFLAETLEGARRSSLLARSFFVARQILIEPGAPVPELRNV